MKIAECAGATAAGGSLSFFLLYAGTKNSQLKLRWKSMALPLAGSLSQVLPLAPSLPTGKAPTQPERARPLCQGPSPASSQSSCPHLKAGSFLMLQSFHCQDPSLPLTQKSQLNPCAVQHPSFINDRCRFACVQCFGLQSYFRTSFDLYNNYRGRRTHGYYYSHVKTQALKSQVTCSGSHSQEMSKGGSDLDVQVPPPSP